MADEELKKVSLGSCREPVYAWDVEICTD